MKNKIIIPLFLLLAWNFSAAAQTSFSGGDKYSLLTMPFNKRPLNLYRGQFQTNVTYRFAVLSRQFDSGGNLTILKDLGIASVYHYYEFDIKYGLTSFIGLSASTTYLKRGIRSQSTTYVSSTEQISVNELNEEKGIGDILLLASIRLPIEYRWFDAGISGGLYMPSAPYQPLKPDHSVTDVALSNVFTVNYHYKNTIGYGVPVMLIAGELKTTWSNLSFVSRLSVRDPVEEGVSIRWDETLTAARTFNYSASEYKYLPDRTYDLNVAVHYQAAGWLNTDISFNYFKGSGGWTEYRNPEKTMLSIEPGFEIQISPAVRIYQKAGFPISGKNNYAPFYINFILTYNTIRHNR
jgi:hypothetical protein